MSTWKQRYLAFRRLRERTALWYHPSYAMPHVRDPVARLALERSDFVVAHLAERALIHPGQLRSSPTSSIAELSRVHTLDYLESLLEARTLARIFGVSDGTVAVDPTLEAQRRMVGGTVAAARCVVHGHKQIAVNLGGGLHHAFSDRGSGFCAYNDIAVAVAHLRHEGFSAPLAIIDLDFHQGDGTEMVFADDESVLTYSMHGAALHAIEAKSSVNIHLDPRTRDRDYLLHLRRTLPHALKGHKPRLVFYIAGTDVLVGDRLGAFCLSPRGVLERDRRVLAWARALSAPMVITLGGGYNHRAWRSTAALLRLLLTDDVDAAPPEKPNRGRLYYSTIDSLDDGHRDGGKDPFDLSEEDIMGSLERQGLSPLILGIWSDQALELELERQGFLNALRERGFFGFSISTDTRDSQRQRVRVFAKKPEFSGDWLLLAEIVMGQRLLAAPPPLDRIHALYIEWLILQNPTLKFGPQRPALPDQRHPGLGLAEQTVDILTGLTRGLKLDGIAARSAHYHNASVGRERFLFLDPADDGFFRAVSSAVFGYSLADATHAIDSGHLICDDETTVSWDAALQVLPLSETLRGYFASEAYAQHSRKCYRRWRSRNLRLRGPRTREADL